jgi:small subunit ribosomal protein S17
MNRTRQEKVGIVTACKMQKTVTVTVDRQFSHPLYKKVVRRSKKFLAHDEKNECHVGDVVRIQETRPLSRQKRWRILTIIARGAQVAEVREGAE